MKFESGEARDTCRLLPDAHKYAYEIGYLQGMVDEKQATLRMCILLKREQVERFHQKPPVG